METHAAPYPLGDGECAHIAIANDITEKVEREDEFDRQKQALVESSRLAALGQFVAGIAHEINNPLCVISGHASYLINLLKSSEVDTGELRSTLELIAQTPIEYPESAYRKCKRPICRIPLEIGKWGAYTSYTPGGRSCYHPAPGYPMSP